MMMPRLFLHLVLLCVPAALYAVPPDDVERHVMQGIDYLYAVRFDDAARSFESAIAADRSDPRGYFYRAHVHLWSYIFDRREAQLDMFLKMSDQAIEMAEKRVDANGRDARSKLFLGMSYGYKAIANARAENFMAAAISARACHDKLSEVVRDDPKMADAYLGLGIFHVLLGSVPKAAQFLSGLGGIKGDAKLGLKEIEIVANRGTYFRNDAQLILAMLNIYYLEDLGRGLPTLEAMSRKYPRNVGILYAIASAYDSRNQADKAIGYYEQVIKQGNDDFKIITDLSYGRCGIAYVMKNDVARAKPYLQKFIKSSPEKTYRAYSWYLLGLCFEMEGDRAHAVKAYDYALKSPGFSSPEDRMAQRKARELKQTPMSATDQTVMRALNAVQAGNFASAYTQAASLAGRSDLTPAQRACAEYAIGRVLQERKEYAKAVEAYKSALAAGTHGEQWVLPYSYVYLAKCYLAMGDHEKWRTAMGHAKRYSGYDNEPQLRFLIERDVTLID